MRLPFGLTGVWGYVTVGVLALALLATIVLGVNSCKKTDQTNRSILVNSGEVLERSKTQAEVINNAKKANDAVTNPTSTELNVLCDTYDRNCKNSK